MSEKVEQVGGTSGTSQTCSTPTPSQKWNNSDLFRYLFRYLFHSAKPHKH